MTTHNPDAWIIDQETGAILHREIARRALEKVRARREYSKSVLADKKKSPAQKHGAKLTLATPPLRMWRSEKETMPEYAKHVAWCWRVAHGDLSDSYVLSDREMAGLATDGRVNSREAA